MLFFLALFPIAFFFFALAVRHAASHKAALAVLVVGSVLAVTFFDTSVTTLLGSVAYGTLTALFPIVWIVLAAILVYRLSDHSGAFTVLKEQIGGISHDRRVQTILIAYCFGAFLEGATGFGAPVAITSAILLGIGFRPMTAAIVCLIANAAPVAFGGIGIPVITTATVTGIDAGVLARIISFQLFLLAALVPFWLIWVVAGRKKMLEIWPLLTVAGLSYSVTMLVVAWLFGPNLPNIVAACVAIVATVWYLKVTKQKPVWRFPDDVTEHHVPHRSKAELFRAWAPYVLLIILAVTWSVPSVEHALGSLALHLKIPGSPATYHFNWLGSPGTAIFISAVLSLPILKIRLRDAAKVAVTALKDLYKPILTIVFILSFAFVAGNSGMLTTLGAGLAAIGFAYPVVSPLIGWLGVFVTGSDTASGALFGGLQKTAATKLELSPEIIVATGSSGGVSGKMISPQSISIAAGVVGETGHEALILKRVIWHSLAFVGIISVIGLLELYVFEGWLLKLVHA